MRIAVTKDCACGCGRQLGGRRSHQRYATPACRVRAHRARPVATIESRPSGEGQGPRRRVKAVSQYSPTDDVTLSDRPKVVHCGGCGVPMPKPEGPLPVAVFCRVCVAAARCPCFKRPSWQARAS